MQPDFIAVKYKMNDDTYKAFTGVVVSRKVKKSTIMITIFWGSNEEKETETRGRMGRTRRKRKRSRLRRHRSCAGA